GLGKDLFSVRAEAGLVQDGDVFQRSILGDFRPHAFASGIEEKDGRSLLPRTFVMRAFAERGSPLTVGVRSAHNIPHPLAWSVDADRVADLFHRQLVQG